MIATTKTSAQRRKTAARFSPAKLRSKADLAVLQSAMAQMVMRPLTPDNRMRKRWPDGRATADLAGQIAKPNDRLTSFERIEIYNRSYWFRVLDSLYEDCPALRAVMGDKKFLRMAEEFMQKRPSRYWTLRDLPEHLAEFILAEPNWTRPHTALCHDIARFEWAQVEVYDTASLPLFTMDDLLDADPSRLKLNLQPYLQLLELDYPVDDFILAVRDRENLLRGDTSGMPAAPKAGKLRTVALPRRESCCVAVHRHGGRIYIKRLDPAAFKVLCAIRSGKPLAAALAAGLPKRSVKGQDLVAQVRGWFSNWMELGWFCRRNHRSAKN